MSPKARKASDYNTDEIFQKLHENQRILLSLGRDPYEDPKEIRVWLTRIEEKNNLLDAQIKKLEADFKKDPSHFIKEKK
ncbi:hypothetical protein LCGC14_2824140 [marine sediment metagenome]|uniref:Uncharacterized protein n=1 Tax=marine sediment metagenome TaxID=412755 RepID=A0A0F8YFZ1_9ZZZZ